MWKVGRSARSARERRNGRAADRIGRTSHKRGEQNWLLFLAVVRRTRAQGKDRSQQQALSERAVGLRGLGKGKGNEEKATMLRAKPREQNGPSGDGGYGYEDSGSSDIKPLSLYMWTEPMSGAIKAHRLSWD